ncbi:MAG: hypothetical protein WDA11_07855 [Thiohalomonadaceae bacterium]
MDMSRRTAREVLDDHLQRANAWDFEGDLARNFSDDIVRVTAYSADWKVCARRYAC